MGTTDVVTSKEEKSKKLKLIKSGHFLSKFGKGNSKVTICCISDTHDNHQSLEMNKDIDILIVAGDFTDWHNSNEEKVNEFLTWLKEQKAKYKFLVCGNHELYFSSLKKEKKDALIEDMKKNNIAYLENNFGFFPDLKLNVYGFPQTLKRNIFYMANAFEVPGTKMNEICNKVFDKKIDILVTHCPPYNIRDKTYKQKHIGSKSILEDLVLRVKPKIHIFGHNHDSPGYSIYEYEGEEFLFVNASVPIGTQQIFDYYYDSD